MVLLSGYRLTINTTQPAAYRLNFQESVTGEYKIALKDGSATGPGNINWPYKFAELVVNGSIVLQEGSIVNVTGKYGLSIRSLTGDINISTDINMTCNINAAGMDMCLGGYAPSVGRCAGEFIPGKCMIK